MGELLDGFKNVVTLGKHNQLKAKLSDYRKLRKDLRSQIQVVEEKRLVVNHKLEALVEEKKKSLLALKKIKNISKNLRGKDREFTNPIYKNQTVAVQLSAINKTIAIGEGAINASKGLACGVSTALGSWALVSTYGTASTGIAIGTLSGATATNATLAWFGGGALSAGGGGMAVGTTVLGGLVVVPAIIALAALNYVSVQKKIREVSRAKLKTLREIDNQKRAELAVEALGDRIDELLVTTKKARETFLHEYKRVYKAVYPYNFISKIFKYIRSKLFEASYFTDKDLGHIQHILNVASEFRILIDQKVIDETGRLL